MKNPIDPQLDKAMGEAAISTNYDDSCKSRFITMFDALDQAMQKRDMHFDVYDKMSDPANQHTGQFKKFALERVSYIASGTRNPLHVAPLNRAIDSTCEELNVSKFAYEKMKTLIFLKKFTPDVFEKAVMAEISRRPTQQEIDDNGEREYLYRTRAACEMLLHFMKINNKPIYHTTLAEAVHPKTGHPLDKARSAILSVIADIFDGKYTDERGYCINPPSTDFYDNDLIILASQAESKWMIRQQSLSAIGKNAELICDLGPYVNAFANALDYPQTEPEALVAQEATIQIGKYCYEMLQQGNNEPLSAYPILINASAKATSCGDPEISLKAQALLDHYTTPAAIQAAALYAAPMAAPAQAPIPAPASAAIPMSQKLKNVIVTPDFNTLATDSKTGLSSISARLFYVPASDNTGDLSKLFEGKTIRLTTPTKPDDLESSELLGKGLLFKEVQITTESKDDQGNSFYGAEAEVGRLDY